MGRCTNTDREWDGDTMLTHGTAPIIYEHIAGDLSVKSKYNDAEGWMLDPVGNRVSALSVSAADNGFTVTIGGGHLYEIVVK